MTYPDFQGKRASASSNPAVSDSVAKRRRVAPIISILSQVRLLIVEANVRFSRPACLWYGKPLGIAVMANMSAGIAAGTL
jgi:hypothetical protein